MLQSALGSLGSVAERVLSRIEKDVVLSYAQQLIRIPSVNPPGDYAAVSGWVKQQLEAIGLEVQTLEGEVGRTNVIGKLKGSGGGEAVCFSAHTDVVSVGDVSAWKYPPFEARVEEGILYGRGSADSKGQLACILAAVRAIAESGIKLKGDLWVTAPVDDETAGPKGLRHIFDTGTVKARHVVYGEATRFKIKRIYKSRIWFSVEVIGKSAHGAFPDHGINAIDKAYDVIKAVRSIELRNHPIVGRDTVSVGVIQGGDQVNMVAGRAKVWFDVRWAPGRSSEDIKREVYRALEAAKSRDSDLQLGEIEITEQREPLDFGPTSPLIAAVERAGREYLGQDFGDDAGWYSSGDLFWLWKNGHIDTGIVWGPGDPTQAHKVDEQIPVADLVDGAKLFALTALHVCS